MASYLFTLFTFYLCISLLSYFQAFSQQEDDLFSRESGKHKQNVFLCRRPYNMQLGFFLFILRVNGIGQQA